MPRQTHAEAVRTRTLDRGPPGERTPIHTVGVIGPKRKLLPDGSLLCEDVPIARTGTMFYAPGEVPLKAPVRPGAASVIHVTRDAYTLFAPEALGSAIGAAITNDHPPVDVNPENWSTLSKGFVLDAWRGTGAESELMFADIIIKDQGLIHKINSDELREVSLGYSAAYEQTGDGTGRQRNIIINHLALVERGRCGPRCAIGDRDTLAYEEGESMPRTTDGQPSGGQRKRNRLEIAQELVEVLGSSDQEDEENGVHVHVHMGGETARTGDRATTATPDPDEEHRTLDAATETRIAGIEDGMLEMRTTLSTILERLPAPAGSTAPPAQTAQTGDSAALATSFQQMVAQAEILVPGFRVPTFDSAQPRARTVDNMCATRRSVLTQLANTTDGTALLGQVSDDGFDVAQADCAVVATVFKAAASMRGGQNNRAATGDRMSVPGHKTLQPAPAAVGGVRPMTDVDINKQNAEYWSKR